MSGILHNPFLLSIGTWIIIYPLRLIVTYCALNSAVHTASHSFTMEKNEPCVILGMIWPSHAHSGKAGKYSRYGLLNFMVCPFGNSILMGGPMFVDGTFGAYTCK